MDLFLVWYDDRHDTDPKFDTIPATPKNVT